MPSIPEEMRTGEVKVQLLQGYIEVHGESRLDIPEEKEGKKELFASALSLKNHKIIETLFHVYSSSRTGDDCVEALYEVLAEGREFPIVTGYAGGGVAGFMEEPLVIPLYKGKGGRNIVEIACDQGRYDLAVGVLNNHFKSGREIGDVSFLESATYPMLKGIFKEILKQGRYDLLKEVLAPEERKLARMDVSTNSVADYHMDALCTAMEEQGVSYQQIADSLHSDSLKRYQNSSAQTIDDILKEDVGRLTPEALQGALSKAIGHGNVSQVQRILIQRTTASGELDDGCKTVLLSFLGKGDPRELQTIFTGVLMLDTPKVTEYILQEIKNPATPVAVAVPSSGGSVASDIDSIATRPGGRSPDAVSDAGSVVTRPGGRSPDVISEVSAVGSLGHLSDIPSVEPPLRPPRSGFLDALVGAMKDVQERDPEKLGSFIQYGNVFSYEDNHGNKLLDDPVAIEVMKQMRYHVVQIDTDEAGAKSVAESLLRHHVPVEQMGSRLFLSPTAMTILEKNHKPPASMLESNETVLQRQHDQRIMTGMLEYIHQEKIVDGIATGDISPIINVLSKFTGKEKWCIDVLSDFWSADIDQSHRENCFLQIVERYPSSVAILLKMAVNPETKAVQQPCLDTLYTTICTLGDKDPPTGELCDFANMCGLLSYVTQNGHTVFNMAIAQGREDLIQKMGYSLVPCHSQEIATGYIDCLSNIGIKDKHGYDLCMIPGKEREAFLVLEPEHVQKLEEYCNGNGVQQFFRKHFGSKETAQEILATVQVKKVMDEVAQGNISPIQEVFGDVSGRDNKIEVFNKMLEQVQPKDRVAIFHQVIVQDMTLARQMLENSADCYLDDLYNTIKSIQKADPRLAKTLADKLNLLNIQTEQEGRNVVDVAFDKDDIDFIKNIGLKVVNLSKTQADTATDHLKDGFGECPPVYQTSEGQHFIVLDKKLLAQVRDTPISDEVKRDIIAQAESKNTAPQSTPSPPPLAYTTVIAERGR